MSKLREWASRIAGSFGGPRRDRELAEELESHLQMEIDDLVRRGVSPAEARRRALIHSGGMEVAKEAYRRQRRVPGIDWFRRDLRYAWRGLVRRPGFTVVAVLTLALGIGANTAIFSLFNQALRAPLGVQEPERLVNLGSRDPATRSSTNMAGGTEAVFSYAAFRELEREQGSLVTLAAHRAVAGILAHGEEVLTAQAMLVSGSYFPTLGVGAVQGRVLGPDDDRVDGGHPVAVLGHDFWASRFGSDPSVVGRTLVVNGERLEIVGVAAEGFQGTTFGVRPAVYVPMAMRLQVASDFEAREGESFRWIYIFGRLQDGVTPVAASTVLDPVYRRVTSEAPPSIGTGGGAPISAPPAGGLTVQDGRRGQSAAHRSVRVPALLLFLTAGVVLFIACANIANILLARGVTRGTEMAVRLSMGAGRWHLLRQLVLEAIVLAVLAAGVGLIVARGSITAVLAILPAEAADFVRFELNPAVLWFAALLSLVVGTLFGIVPALHGTRSELMTSIRAGAPTMGLTRAATFFRASLVNVQVALSVALLISAGLFLKSLANVRAVDLGMAIEDVVTFSISPELIDYAPGERRPLFERLEEELRGLPGVTAVTSAEVPVVAGSSRGDNVRAESALGEPTVANVNLNMVGAGFAAALGMEVAQGREFTPSDRPGASRVAVVNEAFVARFDLGPRPIGKRVGVGGADGPLDIEIVGVLRDAAYSQVRGPVPPVLFLPWPQREGGRSLTYYVRSSLPTEATMSGIRTVVRGIDPDLPIERLRTMPDQIHEVMIPDLLLSRLSAAFAVLATALAMLGLYGVMAYSVAARTREMGLRMALGARPAELRTMVVLRAAKSIALGGGVGLLLAYFIGRAAEALLFQTDGADPTVFAGALGILIAAALLAAYLPTHRASTIDPMTALRTE